MTEKCSTEKDLTEKLMIEEYKVLRQEHENNRKLIFERPLILLAGALATVANFKEVPNAALAVLPLIFLTVLWFNLWFTYGRMISSSRIVAYIQVVHEAGGGSAKWIGWESALHAHREYQYKVKEDPTAKLAVDVADFDGNKVYENVFYFHLVSGFLCSLVSFSGGKFIHQIYFGTPMTSDWIWLVGHVTLLVLFLIGSLKFGPAKVRPEIRLQRAIWLEVLPKADPPHASEFSGISS